MSMRTLGVLGGMGPAATVDFVRKVIAATPASRDQDHVPMVVWSDPRIPDRTNALLNQDGSSPVTMLQQGARGLEAAGCGFIAIACNTAHHWHSDIQKVVAVPVLHIADAAIAALLLTGGDRGRRVALMCTDGTLASGFYDRRLRAAGFDVTVPPETVQAGIMAAIQAVKAGDRDTGRKLATSAAAELLNAGADILLLGCTELPIVMDEACSGLPLLDATEIFARACVARATQDEASREVGSDLTIPHLSAALCSDVGRWPAAAV